MLFGLLKHTLSIVPRPPAFYNEIEEKCLTLRKRLYDMMVLLVTKTPTFANISPDVTSVPTETFFETTIYPRLCGASAVFCYSRRSWAVVACCLLLKVRPWGAVTMAQ